MSISLDIDIRSQPVTPSSAAQGTLWMDKDLTDQLCKGVCVSIRQLEQMIQRNILFFQKRQHG